MLVRYRSNDVGSDNALEGHPLRQMQLPVLEGQVECLVLTRIQFRRRIPVYSAWKAVDEGFKVDRGAVSIKQVLDRILCVPFGYDWNTAALLFASWFGCNRADLELSVGRKVVSIIDIAVGPKGKFRAPKDFLTALASAGLRRRDPGEVESAVKEILERLATGKFRQDEAETASVRLTEYLQRDGVNQREEIQEAAQKLEADQCDHLRQTRL